ncbi:histidine kinase dimerization/phosphoacceptor domain -containing protein [Azospirillum sp. BE72]|uniref:sensor histidine kinase n=1 Tax=Azospirillum sp. BE72 TaxID=2817776 RepID=UPI00285D2801|nr:histidine kinase dimerization/phosphoacceptor domain -containing protein [Azospirillum sp. BE72]MDR6773199.1 PAS domain S-box-containing protein [Azospirillum sp. BE72]
MPGNSRDQKDAEKMVREEEARGGPFVVAAESTLMPMLIADPTLPDVPIVFVNAAFIKLSGYAREEVLGRSYHLLSGSDTDPEVARAIDLALRAGEAIVRQVQLYRKDGKELWVLQHVAPVFEEGRIRYHFGSFVDITERKAAENELRKLNEELDRRVSLRTERLDELNRKLADEVERRIEVERVLRNTLHDKDLLMRDKDDLMREVNHRVKNTLQMASSFLRIQLSVAHSQGPTVQEALHSAVERLDRMAEIHEKLYRAQGLQEIEFGGYLGMLCRDLLASFGTEPRLNIALDVDADEAFLKPDQAIPLALIANEAMINSLKYAFPDGRSGRIAVSFRHTSRTLLCMTIVDDGVGMSGERRVGSLGLTLMELLAEQIDGGVTVRSDKGTTVTVSIPA